MGEGRGCTLYFRLVLFLVGGEESVVGLGTAKNGTLGAHGVRFTGQGTGAKGTVGELHTALLFNIDGCCVGLVY